jgi:hypothetical protein
MRHSQATQQHFKLALVRILAAGLLLAGTAQAATYTLSDVLAQSVWQANGEPPNEFRDDATSITPDALIRASLPCHAGPVGTFCGQGGPSTGWGYQLTGATAEAQTAFGVNRVRLYSAGPTDAASLGASARSEWEDDFTYTGAVPGLVTFELTFDAAWNDFGYVSLATGFKVPFDDPELGLVTRIEGELANNCAATDPSDRCDQDNRTILIEDLGQTSEVGQFDLVLYVTRLFQTGETATFYSGLTARAGVDGAEVDAFNTTRLTRILLESGGSITSVSGTPYSTAVVPAPATGALLGTGFASLIAFGRRVRQRRWPPRR